MAKESSRRGGGSIPRVRIDDPPKVERRGGPRYGNKSGKRGGHHGKGGRPPNVPNKATAAIRQAAAESGELPHEFMLRVMRMGVGKFVGDHQITWDDVKWAAQQAASFFAPKMSSMKVSGDKENPLQLVSLDAKMLQKATPEQLRVLGELFSNLQTGMIPQVAEPTVSPDEYAKTLN